MDLKKLLNDHQLYHSSFQMDNFITVRAGETQYGQYKQTLRELFKRYRGLKELYVARELLQVDIEELDHKHSETDFEVRRKNINLAKHRMDMEDLERNISDTEREFKRFYAQADALKAQIGELTSEKRDKLDQEMWTHKLKTMVAVDYITKGRIGENALTFIRSIPKKIRKPLLAEIKDQKALLEWFDDFDQPLPDIQIEANINVQKLLGQ
jgi:chromosome segregation ATPase